MTRNPAYENTNCRKPQSCDEKPSNKYVCCCDTSKLREILLTFKLNDTPVLIFTETHSSIIAEQPLVTELYVRSIIGDMVYLSDAPNSNFFKYIIPIGSISLVISIKSPLGELSNIIKCLATKPIEEKSPCCDVTGIGNTLNSFSSFQLSLYVKNFLLFLYSYRFILIMAFATSDPSTTILLLLSCPALAANDDISIFYSSCPSATSSAYVIIPTCKIDYISSTQQCCGLSTNQIPSSIPNPEIMNNLLSSLPEEARSKILNYYNKQLSNISKNNPMTMALEKIEIENTVKGS